MRLIRFIGLFLLLLNQPCDAAVSSSEYSAEASNVINHNEEDFEVFQNSEEARKMESIENVRSRFGDDPPGAIPAEQGNAFQGDILLTAEQRQKIFSTKVTEERTGFLDEDRRWPKNKAGRAIVPYVIDRNFTIEQATMILKAMSSIEKVTCIRFRKRRSQGNYVIIRPHPRNCQAALGKKTVPGSQLVELAAGCFQMGTVMHEFIHILGYTHMHNHPERDLFVKIHRNRIADNKWHNFAKVNVKEYGNFNTPYDYLSVMHYPRSSFAREGLRPGTVTIEPWDKRFASFIGERQKLSRGDVTRLNNMYKCLLKYSPVNNFL